MAKMLHRFEADESNDNDWQVAREKSHKTLEKVLKEGKYPKAECREDMGQFIFEVWSGPEREG